MVFLGFGQCEHAAIHMNPCVPVASRSNQAGQRVQIWISTQNDQGFISFIFWRIFWFRLDKFLHFDPDPNQKSVL